MSVASNPKANADAHSPAGDWRLLAVAGVLVLAALGAYWNSFNVPFLMDDEVGICENASIRHLWQVGDVLSPPTTSTTTGRPLLNLTFALNYAWGGLSVRGYHVVNWLIHVCAGLALLGLVRRTLLLPGLRSRYGNAALPLAAFVALLWTLHPLQTGAVTYISQRAESLMGLFYLLTLYGFVRSKHSNPTEDNKGNEVPKQVHRASFPSVKTPISCGGGWLIVSVVACFCGMATKQVMVTAPVLVLLYDRAFVSGSFRSALAGRRWYYAGLAAAWIGLGVLMHQSSLTAVSVGFHTKVSGLTYALTELSVVTDYLKLAFWPHPLVFDYGTEIFAIDPLAAALSALVIVTAVVGAIVVWRRSPMAGFLGCWFFLILAPTSTVVPITEQPMAESRVYLPLAAVAVSMALLSFALVRRRAFVALGIIAVLLGVLTVRRNHDYRSEVSIWEDSLVHYPGVARAHNNLANILAKIPGRLADAIAHYKKALALKLNYAEAHNNLAAGLSRIPGRLPEAITHYEEALRLQPGSAETHSNLANALVKMPGRLPDAIAHYETALRMNPDIAEAHNGLASVFTEMPGRLPEAIDHFEEALRLKPGNAKVHNSLARALAEMPGRLPDAIAHYEEALRLDPGYAEAHYNLAMELAKMPGRLPEAIGHYEETLRITPDSAQVHNNLANGLVKMPGRMADAIAHYEETLRLNPASAETHNNFANVLAQKPERLPEAIRHYEEAIRLNPAYADAHGNLASVLAGMPGRSADAIAHYEQALLLRPDLVEAHNGLAGVLVEMPGRLDDAIAHGKEAVRLKPDNVDARNNLAVYYARAGLLEAAIEQLEIAARLNPGSPIIRQNLERLKTMR